jgi:beta-lactamase regulating signal transducer with metallopeptidase domain
MIDPMAYLGVFPAQSIEWVQLLLDLALKGAVILLAGRALSLLLRRSSAAARHLVCALTLLCLLLLSPLTIALPEWRLSLLPSLMPSPQLKTESTVMASVGLQSSEVEALAIPVTAPVSALDTKPLVSLQPAQTASYNLLPLTLPFHWSYLVLSIWLIGVLIVLWQLATATFRVWAVTREAKYLTDYNWTATAKSLEAQLQLDGHVPLLRSEFIKMPMTWGILKPVVLLPADSDWWSAEYRRVVLLHELAHIRRRDCLTQILAQLVCALHWFNPLVWRAARQMRLEREMACDDYVLGVGTRASDYASYLLNLARSIESVGRPSSVAVGMACSHLEKRVQAILNPEIRRNGLSLRFKAIATAGAFCLAMLMAALEPWAEASAQREKKQTDRSTGMPGLRQLGELRIEESAAPGDSVKEEYRRLREAHLLSITAQIEEEQSNPESSITREQREFAHLVTAVAEIQTKMEVETETIREGIVRQSRELREAQREMRRLEQQARVEQRRMQRLQNRALREAQRPQRESWRRLFPPNILRGQNPAGGQSSSQSSGLTAESVIRMKMSGVTPEFAESMRRAGYDDLTVRDLVRLRMLGIDEEFVKEARALSSAKPSVSDLVRLKLHGVNPEYVRELKKAGYNLPIESLTKMRRFGVTPEFIESMRKLGYDNLTADQLTKLSIYGVTEGYVKEMREAGFDKLTVEELTKLKMFGVTPEYVKKLRAAGFKNISANQLLEMKMRGIDKILMKN